MPALSPTSTAPLFTVAQQVPTDESARHTPSVMDSMRKALAKHVDALQEAALNRATLNNIGALILDKELAPCGKSLSMLLYPPAKSDAPISREGHQDFLRAAAKTPAPSNLPSAQTAQPTDVSQPTDTPRECVRKEKIRTLSALWEQQVSYIAAEFDSAIPMEGNKLKRAYFGPPLPRSLIEFADDYWKQHPHEPARNFILPFEQLALRGIPIPDDIALVFTNRILSFDTFRTMVQTYVTQLPIPTQKELDAPAAPDKWKDETYWEHALAALCSPLAIECLKQGKLTPEELLDWTGLKKRIDRLSLDPATRGDDSPPASELSEPITVLLATSHLLNKSESDRTTTSKAAFLKNLDKLRALADSLVPRLHIAYLLSLAGSVDGDVLEREMDRVAKQNRPLSADMSPTEQALYYSGLCMPTPTQSEYLAESKRIMNPYQTIHGLCADKRLETWAVVKATDGDPDARTRLERRPARALFEHWTTAGMPVERQALIGGLMAQGFDETQAQDAVNAHANDLAPLRAWLEHTRGADLYLHSNGVMTAAVTRWLADKGIHKGVLSALPAMIQCDMGVDQIDEILHIYSQDPNFFCRVSEVFRSSDTPQKVRYGLITPAQLFDQVVYGRGLDALTKADLRDVSELSRKATENRDQLRLTLLSVETLRAGMAAARTPQASLSESLADVLKKAIAGLDDVLKPRTDAQWKDEFLAINDNLTVLVADLNYRMASLADSADNRAAELRQFV